MNNEDSFAAVFSDLVELWRNAPSPVRIPVGEWQREEQSRAAVVALAWGWLVRMIRTAEAAVLLQASGFRQEAAPLERSALEHSIRLHWAMTAGTKAFEIALRGKKSSIKRMKDAQSRGWSFTEDQLVTLEEDAAMASEDFLSEDHLQHLKHIVDQDPAMKPAYMAWLHLTQLTHPTTESARPYYEWLADGLGYELHMVPLHPHDSVEGRMGHCMMFGLVGYSSIADLGDYFNDPLDVIASRWGRIAEGPEEETPM